MKIKTLSCEQFAGVRDRNLTFTEGLNVIFGKNESGKSTMVNLLDRTLFQKAKLDSRRDKDFSARYFPSTRKSGDSAFDFADGKLTFETEDGTYTLSKEWGSGARCTLTTPDGSVREQQRIDEILKEALLYGEGVYSELLFSSQRDMKATLETLLDAPQKLSSREELTNVLSQAFAESDGISLDSIEQAIQNKIKDIAGAHWDETRDQPVRKAGRWVNGLGEILKAYYAFEDAKAALDDISRKEADASRAEQDFAEKDALCAAAEEEHRRFDSFSTSLFLLDTQKKRILQLQKELQSCKSALTDWPTLTQALEQGKALKTEQDNRILLDKYEGAKQIMQALRQQEAALAALHCPTDEELSRAKESQRKITRLENRLCGMNLTAAIQLQNGHSLEITSLRTGLPVDISNGIADICEAVKLTVPGVMELQLSPADVNVSVIEAQLSAERSSIAALLERYSADNLETLHARRDHSVELSRALDDDRRRLMTHLGCDDFAALEAKAFALPSVIRPAAEINLDIRRLCGSLDLSHFITKNETYLSGYVSSYGSFRALTEKIAELQKELENTQASLASAEDIPEEYASISDPQAHLKQLERRLQEKRDAREAALTRKATVESALEHCRNMLDGDPGAALEDAQRQLENQKSLLLHWRHIQQVFFAQKEQLNANPMQDLAESFSRYLDRISGGQVSSAFPQADRLSMQVYSDERPLNYDTLSEGTKETVSLAFRLAALDHLFPDGDGMIVLDDPFVDMDAERTAQGCALLRECATRHQVIFLTCHEEYLPLLRGNQIRI